MRRRPRWVVDTNVLVSAMLWKGTPGRIFELAGEQALRMHTSRVLIDELAATLHKPKLLRYVERTGLSVEQLVEQLRRLATLTAPHALEARISRDSDDDAVLACALSARADLIVSGDDDLLSLQSFQSIPIVTVAQALRTLDAAFPRPAAP